MSSRGRCATTDKRKEVASASKKVASGARRKSEYVLRIPITPSIPTPSMSPSPSTMNIPSTTNSISSPSIRLSQPLQQRPSNPSPPAPKRVARRTSTPIIMVPTPGLRHFPRDTPQSSPVLGSSSQPAPLGPTPNDPHDDMDEDSTEAYPIGLLPDLPPGWIMPTCKGTLFPVLFWSYFAVLHDFFMMFQDSFVTYSCWSYFAVLMDPVHKDAVKKLFHSRASARLSDIFNDASKKNKRPSFITEELLQTLLTKFNHPDHLDKQQKSKQNRASSKGGSVHTVGSINHAQHDQVMVRFLTLRRI
ncbi:hypothetical protein RIF29_39178 [Crotalaria pallida]|uniref:Uncharacterized protein n=1 Tax=Crotalaria pallida TaxID=3830 RepID=A0AAN9E6Z0_CROPI